MPRKILGILTEVLIDSLSDAAIGIDKEGKVHLYNPAAARLFDVTLKNAMGSKVWDALPMTDFTRGLIAIIKEANPAFTEKAYHFPGDRMVLGQLLPVRNEEGRLTGAVGILKDLTHLHTIEGHVTEFVGNITHELRIPLTSIKGFVETLLEGALADAAITRRFLQVINDETNRMARLLMSLQEVTSPQQPAAAPQGSANLRRLLEAALDTLKPLADHKHVTIETDIPERVPQVAGDPDALMQVLTNLIDNAIEFTAVKGLPGRVRITLSSDVQGTGGHVEVRIKDDGVGIPAEELTRVFERFYRVRQGPAAQLGGTGLGLSISRDIVQAHGGDIQVESQPGQGSTFWFALPVVSPTAPAAASTRGGRKDA